MKSLKALAREVRPGASSRDIGEIAAKVGLTPPISILDLCKELVPEKRVYSSGELKALTVTANATLGIASNGDFFFTGKAHEGGLFVSNFIFCITITFKDGSETKNIVFAKDDSLAGKLIVGSPDSTWDPQGNDPRIKQYWDLIKDAKVDFRLSATFEPGSLLLFLVEVVFLAGTIYVIALGGSKPKRCYPIRDEHGGAGIECPIYHEEW